MKILQGHTYWNKKHVHHVLMIKNLMNNNNKNEVQAKNNTRVQTGGESPMMIGDPICVSVSIQVKEDSNGHKQILYFDKRDFKLSNLLPYYTVIKQ